MKLTCSTLIYLILILDTLKFCIKLAEKYVKKEPYVLCLYKFFALEVNAGDYKYAEKILTSQKFLSKSSLYNFLGEALGDGLLMSTNQKWFNRRRIITPTFHFKILRQFFDIFQKQNESLIKELKMKANDDEFDIMPTISMTVLKSLCGKYFNLPPLFCVFHSSCMKSL